MPNFIVPVVGNPNGGYENGDQVTAENLNAHVMNAVPTGDFIAGRNESTTPNLTDYYLKVESDGSIFKIASSRIGANAETADHTTLKVNIIQSHASGNGGSTPYSSILVNNTSNLQFNLGAYSDPADNHGGNLTVNAHGYFLNYKIPHVSDNSQGNANQFYVGDESHRATFIVNSVQTHFRNTWPLDFSYNKKAFILPGGTTSERPVAENGLGGVGSGMFRYNSEINDVEFYGNNATWYGVRTTASTAYPKFQRIYEDADSVLTNGGTWGSRQYGSSFTINCKQAEIFIPEFSVSTYNRDNDGWMYAKVELIARKETEANEYVIGQWTINGNGSVASGGRYIGGTWFLSPSNVDLNGMNLYLRCSANSGWGGDVWYIMKFDSHLGYRPVIVDSAPVVTGYQARLQVKVNNSEGSRTTVFGGGKAFWLKYPSVSQY